MKITIVIGAFFPVPPIIGGAVEKIWFALSREFARRGHDVLVISRASPQLPRSEVLDGVRHVRVAGFDAPRSLVWLKFLDLVYSIRARRVLPKADIVVTNTFWLPILLRSSKYGKVCVQVGRYPKGQMRFYRHVALLQPPTQAIKRAILAEAPDIESKISVIPHPGPQSHTSEPPPPIENREKVILYVGRVHPEKGVHLLVDAFAGKPFAFPGWRLVIVGPTEIKLGGGGAAYDLDLRNRAGDAPVAFPGPIFDPALLEKQFRSAQLFVYPSLAERGETFGIAALEGMTHGCSVIVSDLECFQDFVRDGETGFVFEHHSTNPVESLQAVMNKVIADPVLRKNVSEAGYREAARYSPERIAERYLSDFAQLTN
jgi:glycosyltransferase involved in cell wall biosynthesis